MLIDVKIIYQIFNPLHPPSRIPAYATGYNNISWRLHDPTTTHIKIWRTALFNPQDLQNYTHLFHEQTKCTMCNEYRDISYFIPRQLIHGHFNKPCQLLSFRYCLTYIDRYRLSLPDASVICSTSGKCRPLFALNKENYSLLQHNKLALSRNKSSAIL